jgi:hypothetical protein
VARRDGEHAEVVRQSRFTWGDEIGQREVGAFTRFGHLLAERVDHREGGAPVFSRVELDVLAQRVRGEKPNHTPGDEQVLPHDPVEQPLGVAEERGRRGTVSGLLRMSG